MARSLTVIAETGAGLEDLRPYVASLDDEGTVAFVARLASGGTGLFEGSGGGARLVASGHDGVVAAMISHPDLDGQGRLCVYARLASGGEGLVTFDGSGARVAVETGASFASIGPLGPTMNDRGDIAFRAELCDGRAGVFRLRGGVVSRVADGSRFAAFHGLPVIDERGAVLFRADALDGRRGVYLWREGAVEEVLVSGGRVAEIGSFPAMNDRGEVVAVAVMADGSSAVVLASRGRVVELVDTSGPFASFRGAVIDAAGRALFYATPRGGRLGVYAGPDPEADRVVGLGDERFGSPVAELALNPVSVNRRGQLAVRLGLDDGRQLVVRAEVLPHGNGARSGSTKTALAWGEKSLARL